MAHSLEARVPFLDPVVATLALALPTRLKVRGLSKKRLLRKAVGPLLPDSVVSGRKRGFSIPAAAWLRGPLVPFARDVLSEENVRRQGFFRPEAVTRLLDDHVAARVDLSRWAGQQVRIIFSAVDGGPDNLVEAVRISGAPMVDVSSGVETSPGVKDHARLRAFIAAVRVQGDKG